ncbi:MAG: 30S ribosomal protein S10 [Candidatus Coatesbacteria bacterium]|nr:30S ribosomal protein S10 [Candidatus Coatesbacteria bacterium]
METEKIRVKLRAFDQRLLDETSRKISESVRQAGGRVMGPIPLPTERNVFTVLRSPHVDKKSREQFEIRTHKRLIEIVEPSQRTVKTIMDLNLHLPAGVEIEVKL